MGNFSPTFFGPFYLISQIGKGGTAEVFLGVESSRFDEKKPKQSMYAIKRLLPKLSQEKSFVQCLTSEAKVASILSHPNIVSVSDLGNVGTDYYLSMEWINGKSLFDVLKTVQTKKKAISSHYLMYICNKIARGLDFAHQVKDAAGRPLDIVHCDVSPHNILISYSGKVKLSDFGIATAAKQKEQIVGDTVFGKIHYISPEQISHKGFDYRADIYSFGVLLYESITFKKPFQAKSHLELQNKIRKEIPTLDHPDFKKNKKLKQFVQACLEKDPKNRPKSLLEFQEVYKTTFAKNQVDKKKIARLMQHLFRTKILEEKKLLKSRISQFKKDLQKKEKEDMDRLKKERSRDIVDRTEVLPSDPAEGQTKILRKDEPKEGLGKVALEKKKVVRVIPKAPVVEEVSKPPHDPIFDDEDEIDGQLDESVFDVSEKSIAQSNLEANVDLDDLKGENDDEDTTHVSQVQEKDATHQQQENQPDSEDDEDEKSREFKTKKISTDSFDMFSTKPHFEKTQVDQEEDPDYLVDRPDATIEEYSNTIEKNILNSDLSSDIFYQREEKAPIDSSKAIPKEIPFSDSMKPVDSINEDTFTFSVNIPKSIVRWGLPIVLVCAITFFALRVFQKTNVLGTSIPVNNIQVFVSHEGQPNNLFDTGQSTITTEWFESHLLNPVFSFFKEQYAQYSNEPLDLHIETIQVQKTKSFVWEDSLFKPAVAFDHMFSLFQISSDLHHPEDGRLFAHLFPMETEHRMYPFQYSGRAPKHQHIAFLPTNQELDEAQVMLAHQLLRLMGAKVLTNDKGHPLYPEGYAQPTKKPLHPQPRGEIMTLMIPQSPTESFLLDDLSFATIGSATAKHIGWKK